MSTIYTIQKNLQNTIAGKEAYLQVLSEKADVAVYPKNKAYEAMVEMLEININELKRILTDVELCINDAAANSWASEVDRQGGSFTEEELDPNRGWK